ncbi:MAG: DUF1080 domain-containing protein [Phycisphaerae bacterium]
MCNDRFMRLISWPLCGLLVVGLCSCNGKLETDKPAEPADPTAWRSLFDGKTLKGWKVPEWGGSGKVHVKNGEVHMEMGETCTGITYVDANSLPREDYEIALEAMRAEGGDFFCGLTFPVGKDPISLILGGWAGMVTGLSCINYMDASENETTRMIEYKDKKWYRVRVRVTKTHIFAWVDDKLIISLAREDKKISIRSEVDLSVPLGIATWRTHGVACNIRIRRLTDAERTEVLEEQ